MKQAPTKTTPPHPKNTSHPTAVSTPLGAPPRSTVAANSTSRLWTLDALRGFAMMWMTAFHLSFDLNYFGQITQNFYQDPFWTWQRNCIVGLFLFCAGWAHSQNPRFSWKRWLQIAGCAALVSASSYLLYPNSFIYFGVLHGIAVMLLILQCLAPLKQGLWLVGAGCLVLFFFPPFVANSAPWNILGLISQKPITEDFVPLLPWLAPVCWGYAFGQQFSARIRSHTPKEPAQPFKFLAFAGTYSLRYYMLHQPILLGLLWLLFR